MTVRILFVCLGNICRSPTAEAVVRALLPEVDCDSAATSRWHLGEAPYGPMQRAALARGIDLSDLRARQFSARDFEQFDLIIAMDPQNRADMEALRPRGNETELHLFTDYIRNADTDTVPDPYYTRDFDATLDMIEQAAEGLKMALAQT